jgi:LuxR family maltose regulon positive regulatory protein
VPVSVLADALWPTSEGDAARRNLDTALHRLRGLLGHRDAVVLRAGALSLDRRACWVDTGAFERLCDEIERRTAPRSAFAREELDAVADHIFSLYRGPFLSEEAEAPWAGRRRSDLRRRFSRAVSRLAEHYGGDERSRVVVLLRRAIDTDDLADSLYERLMEALYRQESYDEGIRVYQRYVKVLHGTKDGPAPGPRKLYERMRDAHPR